MQRLRKLLALRTSDKLLLLSCIIHLARTRAGLKVLGYKRYSSVLQRSLVKARKPADPRRIIWGVRAAARVLLGSKCLAQAVTLHFLLARAGHSSLIRVGVAKGQDMTFDAHAWVIFNDQVVIGEAGAARRGYVPLTDLQLNAP
jgi:hypothetical protein